MTSARTTPIRFSDRVEAGEFLAAALTTYSQDPNVLVLGLLRGGVPVAAETARILGVEVDALAVRRLVVPERSDVSFAALASYGQNTSLQYVKRIWGPTQEKFSAEILAAVEAQAREELAELQERLIGEIVLPVSGRTVILVDDGAASGASMLAAIDAVRAAGPKRVIVALPVAPTSARADLSDSADEFISIISPKVFNTVSAFYSRFDSVSDKEIIALIPHL
ncbi:phosphoribosyl transferase [Arthrobacter sp. MYb227]|uniref:phosphoribosyltransferase n=1 Tax=Arthrobacter sp. MYb227 TaxID=1848601 RepID=UPI000CFB90BA|nr:phosphoribosyltransferase family protein [Arthrobacter sp. MYb227]PQZ92151.1 phosphoribosyl transferase [Arthrobacter sp. MYb227]